MFEKRRVRAHGWLPSVTAGERAGAEGLDLCDLGEFPCLTVASVPFPALVRSSCFFPVVPGGPLLFLVTWASPPLGPLFSGPLLLGSSLYPT